MDIERLSKLGFECGVGQVDRQGKNYGFFNRHGAFLTPEGEELVAQLEGESTPATPAETPDAAPKAARPARKAAKKVAEVVETAEDVIGEMGQALLDLGDTA